MHPRTFAPWLDWKALEAKDDEGGDDDEPTLEMAAMAAILDAREAAEDDDA